MYSSFCATSRTDTAATRLSHREAGSRATCAAAVHGPGTRVYVAGPAAGLLVLLLSPPSLAADSYMVSPIELEEEGEGLRDAEGSKRGGEREGVGHDGINDRQFKKVNF